MNQTDSEAYALISFIFFSVVLKTLKRPNVGKRLQITVAKPTAQSESERLRISDSWFFRFDPCFIRRKDSITFKMMVMNAMIIMTT